MNTGYDEKELVDFSDNIIKKYQSNLDNIFENISDETIFRSIINRSYYGAFLRARNKAGIRNEGGSVHQCVINHYEDKKLTMISNTLLKLRRNREKADYKTHEKVSVQDAKLSLKMAKKIIDALN